LAPDSWPASLPRSRHAEGRSRTRQLLMTCVQADQQGHPLQKIVFAQYGKSCFLAAFRCKAQPNVPLLDKKQSVRSVSLSEDRVISVEGHHVPTPPTVERKLGESKRRGVFAAFICFTASSKHVEDLSVSIMGEGRNLRWSILLTGSRGNGCILFRDCATLTRLHVPSYRKYWHDDWQSY